MANLNGKWSYRSFRAGSGPKDTPSQIVVPWAPPGELLAATDATGKVTGTLRFGPGVELTINGSITPAEGHLFWHIPEGIELTGEGLSAVYNVRGFFIDDDHVVGTVVAVRNDLAEQPDGTNGPFALFNTSP
jgi:hypothetical protein